MFPHCNDPGKGVGNRGIEIYIVNYLEPIRARHFTLVFMCDQHCWLGLKRIVWRQLSLPVVLTHLRITLRSIVIHIQSSIVISNHFLTEDYFISIVTSFETNDIFTAISHV